MTESCDTNVGPRMLPDYIECLYKEPTCISVANKEHYLLNTKPAQLHDACMIMCNWFNGKPL